MNVSNDFLAKALGDLVTLSKEITPDEALEELQDCYTYRELHELKDWLNSVSKGIK